MPIAPGSLKMRHEAKRAAKRDRSLENAALIQALNADSSAIQQQRYMDRLETEKLRKQSALAEAMKIREERRTGVAPPMEDARGNVGSIRFGTTTPHTMGPQGRVQRGTTTWEAPEYGLNGAFRDMVPETIQGGTMEDARNALAELVRQRHPMGQRLDDQQAAAYEHERGMASDRNANALELANSKNANPDAYPGQEEIDRFNSYEGLMGQKEKPSFPRRVAGLAGSYLQAVTTPQRSLYEYFGAPKEWADFAGNPFGSGLTAVGEQLSPEAQARNAMIDRLGASIMDPLGGSQVSPLASSGRPATNVQGQEIPLAPPPVTPPPAITQQQLEALYEQHVRAVKNPRPFEMFVQEYMARYGGA